MSVHICRGYAVCDTPGLLVDTTGYCPHNVDPRRANREMKTLPTAPCPDHTGVDCRRCDGYNLVIVGRPSFDVVWAAVMDALK